MPPRLAELLAERGDLDELRARADAGDEDAAWRLAELLAERGDLDGAARPGRRRRRACRLAAGRAAGRARRPGRAARPGRRRRRVPPGSWPSCWPSAATWTRLRARADAGDQIAAWRLAELLAERGDLDGDLRARADAGDGTPPGGWPSCWPSAATWTGCAPGSTPATGCRRPLADLLIKQGRGEEAERLRRFGLNPDGSIAWA